MESAPGTSAGLPETVVPKATSRWPVSHISTCANAAWSTVLTVVWRERASSLTAWVVSSGTEKEATPRRPNASWPAGPTRVGVSNPDSTSPHAARAASRSRPVSQATNLRYGTAAGSHCPQ